MKWFLIISLLLVARYLMADVVAIRGGKVAVTSGYVSVGPSISFSTTTASTAGQCIGILCGVTKAN